MNKQSLILHWSVGVLMTLCLFACRKDPLPPYTLDSISKSQREVLGKRLELAMLTQPDIYPIRSAAGNENEIIYTYIQQYYNQATYRYQLDRRAPVDDRWNQNRLWRVRILNSDVPLAYCFPGGDFYISKGMLFLLKNEAELFALMSFEATLMQEKIILKELSEKYPTGTFLDLLEVGTSEGGLNSRDLLNELLNLYIEEIDLINIDQLTQVHICQSSAFNQYSLFQLLSSLENFGATQWLEQKSYEGRSDFLQRLSIPASCGTRITDGSYQEKVLDLL